MNIGGAESYVAQLARQLHLRGFCVFVASGGGVLAKQLQEEGIQHFFLPIRVSVELSAWLIARFIKNNQIDIIHANSAAAGIVGVLVKKKYVPDLPLIYTAHGVFGNNRKEKILSECDRILCVSKLVRQSAIEKGYPQQKLSVVYNGIDTAKFYPNRQDASSIRSRLGIPDEAFTLGIVSRIKNLQDKGHDDILRVFEKYAKTSEWHLIIIGKGKSLWKIKYRVKKHCLSKRIHCLGHITDVENYLDAINVLVLPSKFETFGLVLAEAMAMEKPVVAYAVGGVPEVVKDGETGFLVERGNEEQLYRKLLMLDNSSETCGVFGRNARKYVETNFAIDKMMRQLIEIYEDVSM